jgi:hypothetical protein
MSGTVNIARDIWQDTAFKAQPFTEREAFVWLIMEASYKAREKRVGNVCVNLSRGQLASSIRFMAEAWDWQKSTVDRFLKRLQSRDMIGTDSGTGLTVITVCKYDEYQSKPSEGGTAKNENRDSGGTAAGQQRDKPNKGLIQDERRMKEEGIGDEPPNPPNRKRRCQLPSGWVPSDRNIADAEAKQFSTMEITNEAERFRDYHASKATVAADWDASWRTWLSNARKWGGSGRSGVSSPDSTTREIAFAARAGRTPSADSF